MNKLLALTLASVLVLSVSACGDSTATDTKQDRAKATIEKLIALAKADDAKAAAPLFVYRGSDKARKWKDVCDPSNEEELTRVKRVLGGLKGLAGSESVTFTEFKSEKESEGEWLIWQAKIGERKIMFACLDINGQVALGDIDT